MLFLHDYIARFRGEGSVERSQLADLLQATKSRYDIFAGGNPQTAFNVFVDRYNWLGNTANKETYHLERNLARNLPGALMQDYLLHLVMQLCEPYPQLDVFTEVRIPFGIYPIWKAGQVTFQKPAEQSDLCVGYLIEDNQEQINRIWPKPPFYIVGRNQTVWPLITINAKIRVSQSEFFDFLGREQLMTRGNPHCLSIEVALRKEMDMDIVHAAQMSEKFFLLGGGTERNVIPDTTELQRLTTAITTHLDKRMGQHC